MEDYKIIHDLMENMTWWTAENEFNKHHKHELFENMKCDYIYTLQVTGVIFTTNGIIKRIRSF